MSGPWRVGRRLVLGAISALPLAGAAFAAAPSAARYRWSSVKVGAGGFIPGIVFSRAEKGLAYVRSDMGGAYRWESRQGSWIALQDGMAESGWFGVESIAPDPRDADVVYAAVGMYRRDPAAILRSADRGRRWEVTPVPFRMGGNEDGRGLGERLAVDPSDTSILYFGSRHDGLQRSRDHGRTWTKVDSFPVPGRGAPPAGRRTNGGISFVVFDPRSGGEGKPSRTIFAGVADEGDGLYRSDDAGETWRRVEGGPRSGLLPVKAEMDGEGRLFGTWCDGVGPNGVKAGAVFRLDADSGAWTDITPDKGAGPGGYMGMSLDRQAPGTLVAASLNRWGRGDTIWRSTDAGRTWRDLRPDSVRDVSATPFLLWGNRQADFGWWMAGLAIDPFDSEVLAYTTGATVYATPELTNADRGQPTAWIPWVQGIEQTAVITLVAPPEGPLLLSGFGDISGFAHDDLSVSPRAQFVGPTFANTNTIDYAGLAPNVVVRSGTVAHRGDRGDPTLAVSTDHGRTWRALPPPRTPGLNRDKGPAIAVAADGGAIMVMTPTPQVTRDQGRTWTAASGLPPGVRPVPDRVDPSRFHALDLETGRLFASADGGASFSEAPTQGLPDGLAADQPRSLEAAWPLQAAPGLAGQLWFVSRQGLYRSRDSGRTFARTAGDLQVEALSFGKAPPSRTHPALFAIGARGGLRAIWRSDDEGASWIRINDEAHEYGRRFRCIAGDWRVFGRVYVGTDGRGILYADPMEA
jgi:xyloglucan-specific exo-beta-1,4-glucanase